LQDGPESPPTQTPSYLAGEFARHLGAQSTPFRYRLNLADGGWAGGIWCLWDDNSTAVCCACQQL